VVFTSTTVDRHTVTVGAGGRVALLDNDTADHRVANDGLSACSELTGGTTNAAGTTFQAGPFTGPKTCDWQDLTNPPTPRAVVAATEYRRRAWRPGPGLFMGRARSCRSEAPR